VTTAVSPLLYASSHVGHKEKMLDLCVENLLHVHSEKSSLLSEKSYIFWGSPAFVGNIHPMCRKNLFSAKKIRYLMIMILHHTLQGAEIFDKPSNSVDVTCFHLVYMYILESCVA
jgi:hypothetical protein